MQHLNRSRLLATVDTAADLIGESADFVRALVREGIVVPAIPGRKGRGRVTCFSGQQLMDLAMCAVIKRHLGGSRDLLRRYGRLFADSPTTNEQLEKIAKNVIELDAYAEEQTALNRVKMGPLPVLPGNKQMAEDMDRTMGRVLGWIHKRAASKGESTRCTLTRQPEEIDL